MRILEAAPGARLSALTTMYPCELEIVSGEHKAEVPTSTTYGYVLDGTAELRHPALKAALGPGAYFSVPGAFTLSASSRVALVTRLGFIGLLHVGLVEERGRLAYIDGCSDTILVPPPRQGDPVLNLLHFPPNTDQTRHAHPSIRLGVVSRGRGTAHGPTWEQPLMRGDVFLLDAHEIHAFRTEPQSGMDVIAFHPDSDWGPTDQAHPMKNRTYLR